MNYSLTGLYEIVDWDSGVETYLHRPERYFWFEDKDWIHNYQKIELSRFSVLTTLMFKRYKL